MTLARPALMALAKASLEGVAVTTDGGKLYAEPAPTAALAAQIREHRAEILAWLSLPEPAKPDPSWRWCGDCWWEDPATGHLHWRESARVR